MSLILAVEPDRRRGRQLSSLVRRFTSAEIVVAQSGAAALSAIGTRVPDLILTPALLPTQDETVLTVWLRDLGDAAAHVQTVAVPILSDTDTGPKEPGSILGRLLDRSEAAAGHGCDPAVFAEQIKVYLDRAAADRKGRGQAPGPTPAAPPSPPLQVAGASSDDDLDFEEISLDSLVLEPLFTESPTDPEPPADPPQPDAIAGSAPRTPAYVQAAVTRTAARNPTSVRTWEKELGLGHAPGGSPALWRVTEGLPDDLPGDERVPPVAVDGEWQVFDPSQPRFRALIRRLDEIVAEHA
jgi:CheY-like chemotaxis protein